VQAGMRLGAQILSLDGKPTEQVVAGDVPWSSPFSTETSLRLQQLRYALRFPLDKGKVAVTYENPNGGGKQTAALNVVNEFDSFSASSFYAGQSPTELPVEFKVLPDGMGYVKVDTFFDNEVLMIQLWERAIAYLNGSNPTGAKLPGLIVDMRQNRGGDGWLAEQMAAYFFDKDTFYGTSSLYNSPGNDSTMIPPRSDLQYDGKIVLMVGPGCVSACEFFSRGLTIDNRATVVGQYPSAGGGGSVDRFLMPMGLLVDMPIGKTVDKDGNIVIEGTGIVPTVKVPVTVSTVISAAKGTDVVLNAAEKEIESEAGAGG
jgi:carboxyl-terminal processing protease